MSDTRGGTRRAPALARRLQRATAALATAALTAGFALPMLEAARAERQAPFCCSKGRCCCATGAAAADERSCLRRACGCGRPDSTLGCSLLLLEAVLPSPIPLAHPRRGARGSAPVHAGVRHRARAPLEPPPRRLHPA